MNHRLRGHGFPGVNVEDPDVGRLLGFRSGDIYSGGSGGGDGCGGGKRVEKVEEAIFVCKVRLQNPKHLRSMELATKAIEVANRAASNNTVINVFLGVAFAGLTVRSFNQQRQIETLESQRESLVKSNKSMRQTIWDWKQKLYADVESDKKPIVPLSKLKSIYGEAPTVQKSVGTTEDGKASSTKIMI
ncbi:hypothetical protein L1987_47038 [Smallanthus sonchifolius]|uniref:Uncharacterized protein n=1 Tax=Smallanthus sonchifolius TaxID=185202 RepID=A0ACB9G1H9_9ASTR|nr:hypothetical protein L1987_47038 [Smallanthus sonchifolius]